MILDCISPLASSLQALITLAELMLGQPIDDRSHTSLGHSSYLALVFGFFPMRGTWKSYIRHEDFLRLSVRPSSSSVTLRGPPLYSETGWTGELWSKTKFLVLEN